MIEDLRDRYSTLWLAAIAVLVVGVILAIVGLLAGGPDQEKRDSLRAEIDRAQSAVATAQGELDTTISQGADYASGAQEIIEEGDQFCGCGQRGRRFQKELETRLRSVVASTDPGTVAAYEVAADRANDEKERFEDSLSELRSLYSSLPEPPG